MHCPSCGNPYQPGNRFCGRCGLALPVVDAAADAPAAGPGAAAPEPQFISCPHCRQDNAAGAAYCFSCGASFTAAPPAGQSGPVHPGTLYPAAAGRPAAFALGNPGGFWRRVPAYLIDAVVVTLPLVLLWMLLGLPTPTSMAELTEPPPEFRRLQLLNAFLTLVYDTALIALYAATVGKRALGLYVVRADGSRIGWGRALSRHLLTALTAGLTLGLVFLVVAIREDKRGLHDLICDTVVVRRDRQGG